MIAPVERRTARFGGSHTSAPWWALLAFLVLGALLLGVLGFLRDVLVSTYFASSQGPRGVLRLAVSAVFAVLQLALIVRVVISWVGGSYSRIGRLAHTLTEWFLGPLRRVLPSIGMVDISPLVAYFALMLVRGFLLGVL
jgi:YggT family protein